MKDKLEIFFQKENGSWYGPVPIKSMQDIEYLLYEHRNEYYKYMVRETKNNTQDVIQSGLLEPDRKKVRKL